MMIVVSTKAVGSEPRSTTLKSGGDFKIKDGLVY